MSWLDFDSRVLALAKEKNVPLGERLKFAAIFGSNMDEFFMVRVGSLYDQTLLKNNKPDVVTHMTASEQIAAITPRVAELQAKCDNIFSTWSGSWRTAVTKRWTCQAEQTAGTFLETYFHRELLPLLSPQIVDSRHPFPFSTTRTSITSPSFITKGDGVSFGIVPVSNRS